VCTIASLAPGQAMTASVVVLVGSGFSAASLTNSASVTSATADPNSANNSASVTNAVASSADVSITKAVAPTSANAGGHVTYTLTVKNAGPSDAQSVTVTDPRVTGLTATSAASSRGTCSIDGATNNVSCPVGLLSPGSSATVTVQADVDPTFTAATLTNGATGSSTTPDPNPANNTATATLAVTTSADVAITKSGPASITANADGVYTLTVSNAGPSQAIGVAATDPLPNGLTFVSSPDGCTATAGTVTCAVGTLAAGASATRRFTFHAPNNVPASVTNTATIGATTSDPTPGNNASTFVSGGANVADLGVTKSVAPAPLVAGGPLTYTMVVTNNGPSTANGVTLSDAVPSGVTITTVTTTTGTCDPAPAVHCTATTLANGQSFTVTATGTIAAATATGTLLTNTASVSSTSPVDPTTSNNSATASGTVTTSGDVGVTLTPQTPTITAGSVEAYTLHITNAGPSVARSVVATGQVPPGLIPIIGSSLGACVLTGQIVTCNLGDLPPGFATDIPLRATVDPSYPPGPISATAFIGASTPDANQANNQSTAVITVIASADLAITKQAPATLVAGGEATYVLTIINNGPSDAATVSVADTLPPALALSAASPSFGSCATAGATLTCTADRLPAGSSLVVNVKVKVSTTAGPTITNVGTAGAATPDPVASNNSSSTTTAVTQAAHLTLTKGAAPSPAVAGASISYTLTIANAGPSNAATVALDEPLPAGLLVLPDGVTAPADGTCTVAADRTRVQCSFATIAAGDSRIVTVDALVPAGTADDSSITDTATITTGTPDPDPSGHSASVTTPVTTAADVAILKTPLDIGVVAGDQHGYLLAVTNNGPSTARAVTISDPLPAGTTFVSAVPTNGTCGAAAGSLSCALGDLTPGQIATVQLTIQLAANLGDTTLANTATAASSTADPNGANNSSTVSQIVDRRADLALTKAISSGPIVAGSPVTYALTLTNNGASDTINARILDPVPAGTTFVSAGASDGGTCQLVPADPTTTPVTPTLVQCLWAQLAVGATRTATITFAVPETAAAGTALANTATAVSAATDPTPESVTVTGTVEASSDVSVTKTLLSGTPTAGGIVRWQVVARNAGPSAATAVTVSDDAPAGTTFTAVTTTAGTCTIGTAPLCALDTMAVGATVTITITGTIDSDYAAATVTNTASVAMTSTDPDPSNNSASSATTVDTSADLAATKVADGPFVAGSGASWTVTVTNNGPSTSRSVVVNDPVPDGVTNVSAAPSGGSGCTVGQSVSCAFGDLAAHTTATVTITATVTPDFVAGRVINTATATAGTPDPDPTNNAPSVTSPVSTRSDVRIAKTGPDAAAPGEAVTWQLTVDNDGPSLAQGVVVTDPLPADLVGARATVGGVPCTIESGTVHCELGAVPVSDGTSATSRVVTVTAIVDPASTQPSLANTATVSSSTSDPDSADNTASTITTLTPRADISIVKSVDASPVVAGQTAGWTMAVANAGPSVARALTVTDTVPPGVTVQSAQLVIVGTTTSCAVDGATVTCTIGDLATGTPASIHLVTAVDQGVTATSLSNTATLTSPTPDPTPDDHASTATTPVSASADVQITKAVDLSGGNPVAGGPIRYLIDVTNNGPSAAQAVAVNDVLPAEIVPASVVVTPTDACTFTAATATLACALGTVDSGGHVAITVDAALTSPATDVSNTATVTSPTPDPLLVNNTSTADAVSDRLADMAMTKTGAATVVAGQPITWTVTAHNNGPSDAGDVVITDTLPAEVTGVQLAPDAGLTCAATATGFSCTAVALANGASASVHVTAVVPSSSQSTTLVNSAAVASSAPDPSGANNNASATTTVTRQAALSVTKAADPAPFVSGRDATYTIVVSNAGPSDAQATLAADTLDPILAPNGPAVPSQGTCAYTASVLNCSLGVVPAGGSATVRVPVHVDPATTATTVTNSATATTLTPAPPGGPPAAATVTADVSPVADLTLIKTAPPEVTAGGPIAWGLGLSNAGPSVAAGVVITDTLPPGLGAMTIVPSQGTCDRTGDTIACALGNVAPGATANVQVSGTVPPDSTIAPLVNTAAATSPAPEPDGTDDGRSAATTTAVVTSADVAVAKHADIDAAVPGRPISWTITVANSGLSVARNVHIADTVPAGITDVVLTGPAGVTCDSAAATCDIPTLAIGADAAVVIAVSADVPADAADATLANEVTVSSDTPDPDPGNNEASATTPIRPSADLAVVKSGPASVVRGTAVTWTLTVSNAGPSVARAVALDDRIPAGVADVSVAGVPAGTCTVAVACTLGDVAPGGAPVVITVRGTVASDLAADSLTNTAELSAATTDASPADNTSTFISTVTASAQLSITKTATPTAVAGGPIRWVITVANAGPSAARAVVVHDPIGAGIANAGATPSVGTCDATINCALGTLAVGASATVTVDAVVAATFEGAQLTNTATAESPDGAAGPPVSATVVTAVSRSADIGVTKTLSAGGTTAGSAVTWTILVSNAGPSAADAVTLADSVPAPVLAATVTTSAGSCALTAGAISCPLGTLVPNTGVTVVVTGTVDPAYRGPLTNTASVSSSTPDPNAANASATATSTVTGVIDLVITKAVDRPEGALSTTAVYTVVASNVGPSTATNVVVEDHLPAGLRFIAAHPSAGAFDSGNGRWTIGTLTPGATLTLQLDVTLVDIGAQTNVATIGQVANLGTAAITPTGDEETRLDNNSANATIVVTQTEPNLPATGSESGFAIEAAALALAGGALLRLAARRRR
jgi:uncharacterized repeat protein (TIGR01451 family)